jgi:hypothetical protein
VKNRILRIADVAEGISRILKIEHASPDKTSLNFIKKTVVNDEVIKCLEAYRSARNLTPRGP